MLVMIQIVLRYTVCVYIYIYIYIYIYTYTQVCVCVCVRTNIYIYIYIHMHIHNFHQSTSANGTVSEALSYPRWREVKCFMLTSCTPSSILSCILNILFQLVDGMEYDV